MKKLNRTARFIFAAILWGTLGAMTITSVDARSVRGERRGGKHHNRADRHDDRRHYRDDHRKARRVVRRAVRRHHYTLPRGHRVIVRRGYRYYYWNGAYHYPYYFGGRLVYVEINLVNGIPILPPSASQIKIEINL